MKSTGIVRRIDDLGRVVIPKEIRRVKHIKEGDPIEIFVNDDGIILRKYDPTESIIDIVALLKSAVNDSDDLKCRAAVLSAVETIKALLKEEANNLKGVASDE